MEGEAAAVGGASSRASETRRPAPGALPPVSHPHQRSAGTIPWSGLLSPVFSQEAPEGAVPLAPCGRILGRSPGPGRRRPPWSFGQHIRESHPGYPRPRPAPQVTLKLILLWGSLPLA